MSFDALARALAAVTQTRLGEPATYRPAAGGSVACSAILTRAQGLVDFGRAEITHATPTLELLVTDAPALSRGDQVDVLGRAWRVIDAPRRSEDGLVWTAAVEDLGPAA